MRDERELWEGHAKTPPLPDDRSENDGVITGRMGPLFGTGYAPAGTSWPFVPITPNFLLTL